MSATDIDINLRELIRSELLSIPLDQWGFFFPVHVAVWRFLHGLKPTLIGELDAGYDGEPYFKGRGAEWFITSVTNNPRYVELVEDIMYRVTSRLPPSSFERGFVSESELPPLDPAIVDQLRTVVRSQVQNAV